MVVTGLIGLNMAVVANLTWDVISISTLLFIGGIVFLAQAIGIR